MEETVNFFKIRPCTVTLTLKIRTHPFRMTLQVMMMHHHTKDEKHPPSQRSNLEIKVVWKISKLNLSHIVLSSGY